MFIFAELMKRLVLSIAVICYIVLTCGITYNAHFCMNRLASVHLFGEKAERCGQCGMDIHESDGCCRDEVSVVKLMQDQNKIPVVTYELPSPESVAITPSVYILTSLFNTEISIYFNNHSPPLLTGQDTYLRNNVFRI